ncbi:MGMT family protein [Enorma phocaeensis]|uniref:MGMT family protein n=1 Tax=Enorma phocaeensis TaxID=1871019 RepID=UPI001EF68D0C|nr:MGMT family protein [Enorma phocaeensis]
MVQGGAALMLKLLIFRCTRCSETGAHSDHFLLHINNALHSNPRPGVVPCHRVVFADGSICEGFAFGGADAQRALLEDEGVTFRDDTHVDLDACRWPAGL